MTQQEFDVHAKSYSEVLDRSVVMSGEDSSYFAEYKIRDLHHELRRLGLDTGSALRLLDFGCGVGASMPYARRHFAQAELIGVDVSKDSLDMAKSRYGELASFLALCNGILPEQASKVDAAYAMCVFHHIEEAMQVGWLSNMRSRLKPGGVMMIYEHNPFNPLTVRVVNNCPFDENAVLIRASLMVQRCREAGFKKVKVRYRVFFPGFLKVFRFTERFFSWLPLGGQYYVRCIA